MSNGAGNRKTVGPYDDHGQKTLDLWQSDSTKSAAHRGGMEKHFVVTSEGNKKLKFKKFGTGLTDLIGTVTDHILESGTLPHAADTLRVTLVSELDH